MRSLPRALAEAQQLEALEKLHENQGDLLRRRGWVQTDRTVVRVKEGKLQITYWRKNGHEFPQFYALFLERNGWRV